jgi:hypothetical protein
VLPEHHLVAAVRETLLAQLDVAVTRLYRHFTVSCRLYSFTATHGQHHFTITRRLYRFTTTHSQHRFATIHRLHRFTAFA